MYRNESAIKGNVSVSVSLFQAIVLEALFQAIVLEVAVHSSGHNE